LPRRRRRRDKEDEGARLRLPVRLRYLIAAGLTVAAVSALVGQRQAMAAWLDRQFPVRTVAVAGDLRHERPQALGRWLGRQVEGGFFTADLQRLRQAVVARPWVRDARLRRRWPGTLVVSVREHRAAARWRPGPDAGWRLVSRQGAVFRPRTAPAAGGLPELQGPRARLADLRARRALLAERLGSGHSVTRVAVDARGDWVAAVDGRVRVHFGRDHWDRRLDRLMRVERGWRLLERQVARVDLRYPDGLAVSLPEGGGGEDGANTSGASARRPG